MLFEECSRQHRSFVGQQFGESCFARGTSAAFLDGRLQRPPFSFHLFGGNIQITSLRHPCLCRQKQPVPRRMFVIAVMVSLLSVSNTRPTARAKRTTATDTTMRLFTGDGFSTMMTIGTIRAQPPMNPMMKRAA